MWNKCIGVLFVLKLVEKDFFYFSDQFKGWFVEFVDKDVILIKMLIYFEEFVYFKDFFVIKMFQEVFLGDIMFKDFVK